MNIRQIIVDTETTGVEAGKDRIVEIACLEIIDGKITQKTFHVFLNPEYRISQEAAKIHGLKRAFLSDKPKFNEIAEDFIAFIRDADLFIHNASFHIKLG